MVRRSPQADSAEVAQAMRSACAGASPSPSHPRSIKLQRSEGNLSAAWDAARTNDGNVNHWKNADGLSPDAAASPAVRKELRQRARYEAGENNSYAKGITLTLANDTIGTGPRLQMLADEKEINKQIERRFNQWAQAVRMADKLRSMKVAKTVDGEAFATFITNPQLTTPVKLDLKLSEADHFTTPIAMIFDPKMVDGITYDEHGNPLTYHRLKFHPGGIAAGFSSLDFEELPASQVIHLFRVDRPGQHRGVSEIAPALPLFSQLRRYTLTCIAAAETAADLAVVLKTMAGAVEDPDDIDTFDAIPIEQRTMLTLPRGWEPSQMKSEHPPTTYEMFKRELINEMARCLNMPYNVAAANSSDYNYASGRLDHQIYFKAIKVEQSYFELECLDRIFAAWLQEAALIPGHLMPEIAEAVRGGAFIPHQWFWDGQEHVDPKKEADAQTIQLSSGTTHRGREYARKGLDIDTEDEKAAASFGMTVEEYRKAVAQKLFGGTQQQPAAGESASETEDEDVTEEAAA